MSVCVPARGNVVLILYRLGGASRPENLTVSCPHPPSQVAELSWHRAVLLVPRKGPSGLPLHPHGAQTPGAACTWTPGWAGSLGGLCSPAIQSERKDLNAPWVHWACRKAGGEQEAQGWRGQTPKGWRAAGESQAAGVMEQWQDALGKAHPMRQAVRISLHALGRPRFGSWGQLG